MIHVGGIIEQLFKLEKNTVYQSCTVGLNSHLLIQVFITFFQPLISQVLHIKNFCMKYKQALTWYTDMCIWSWKKETILCSKTCQWSHVLRTSPECVLLTKIICSGVKLCFFSMFCYVPRPPTTPSSLSSSPFAIHRTSLCRTTNIFKTVLAYKHFPHFEKKKKAERKKKKSINNKFFQPICVWSGLSFLFLFFFFPVYILGGFFISAEAPPLSPSPPEPVPSFQDDPGHRGPSSPKPPRAAARRPELRHDSEDGVVATDARPDLLVVLFGVTNLVKLRSWC